MSPSSDRSMFIVLRLRVSYHHVSGSSFALYGESICPVKLQWKIHVYFSFHTGASSVILAEDTEGNGKAVPVHLVIDTE